MMFLTAKVDLKKTIAILAAVFVVILAAILLLGREGSQTTAAPAVSANDKRVQFLESYGWEVKNSPKETSQVKIPEEPGEVFNRYNTLQKGQGYDLTEFAGKKVMRYVYEITNYPNATEPVYATILMHKNKVIGGDVTDTAAQGKISGFKMPADTTPTQPSQETDAASD